jgi:hypothetical protein
MINVSAQHGAGMGAEERNEDRKPVLAIRQVTQAKVI